MAEARRIFQIAYLLDFYIPFRWVPPLEEVEGVGGDRLK